jgi:cyanophycin synthetase
MKIIKSSELNHLLSRKYIKQQSDLFLLAAKKLKCSVKTLGVLSTRDSDQGLVSGPFFEISRNGKSLLNVNATTEQTSYLGMKLAVNKKLTTKYLKNHQFPVPFQMEIKKPTDLLKILKNHCPIVVKPVASRLGKGVVGNVFNSKQAYLAYRVIKKKMPDTGIIAEEQIYGNEYRAVVINGKFVAALYYQPPMVFGDGQTMICDLIKRENASALRTKGWLDRIKVNEALNINLQALGLKLGSIPDKGQAVVLHRAAPISNGGMMIDVTDKVCKENIKLLENVANSIRLNITGIDIIAPSLETPISATKGKIIEVNGGPDFRIHYNVHKGKSRNLAETVLRDFFQIK